MIINGRVCLGLFRFTVVGLGLFVVLGVFQAVRSFGSLPPVALDHQAGIKQSIAQREFGRAVAALRVAVKLDHRDATWHFHQLAKAAQQLGDVEMQDYAVDGLRRTISLQEPQEARAYRYLVDAVMFHSESTQSEMPEVIDLCRVALLFDPDHAVTHCNLGTAWLRLGVRDEAARHYRNALRLNPTLQQAEIGLQMAMPGENQQ